MYFDMSHIPWNISSLHPIMINKVFSHVTVILTVDRMYGEFIDHSWLVYYDNDDNDDDDNDNEILCSILGFMGWFDLTLSWSVLFRSTPIHTLLLLFFGSKKAGRGSS